MIRPFELLRQQRVEFLMGTSISTECADEVRGAQHTETGAYLQYVRISRTAQQSNSPQK